MHHGNIPSFHHDFYDTSVHASWRICWTISLPPSLSISPLATALPALCRIMRDFQIYVSSDISGRTQFYGERKNRWKIAPDTHTEVVDMFKWRTHRRDKTFNGWELIRISCWTINCAPRQRSCGKFSGRPKCNGIFIFFPSMHSSHFVNHQNNFRWTINRTSIVIHNFHNIRRRTTLHTQFERIGELDLIFGDGLKSK